MTIDNKLTARKNASKVMKVVIPIARWIFLLGASYILLYPLFWMLTTAFRAEEDFYDSTIIWVSKHYSLNNIKIAWKALDYVKGFWNTFKTEIIAAGIEIITCSITAYGLSRFEFKEKKLLMGILILTILVPTQMMMLPNMVGMRYFDFLGILRLIGKITGQELRPSLLNSPLAFWIPSLFSVGLKGGLFIFIYTQFFKGMPKELEEAAYIDGAGPIKTFLTIVVPSSGVVFVTVTMFSIIWHWNDTYLSTLYFSKNQSLSVLLASIGNTFSFLGYSISDPPGKGLMAAACLLVIAPMLIMYCFLQKKFVKSIDRVGIVG